MKQLLCLFTLLFAQNLFSEESLQQFPLKIYTPEVVVDKVNHGEKGAVQLVWQKNGDNNHYEVEVSNGETTYSNVDQHNFHHVMVYFDKPYLWRVRQVDIEKQTQFSPWRALKVIKGTDSVPHRLERQLSSQEEKLKKQQDHYLLDMGG